jgi:hypothetical protein
MSIHPKLKPFLFGSGVFVVFMSLSVVMKLVTHRVSVDAQYFGFISTKDILIGLFVAGFVTFTHERKKKIK